jgi:hypothetical protein
MINLRDGMEARDFSFRHSDRAITWLETARTARYGPATRRLIELYACDEDPELWNARLAIDYAEELLKNAPPNDHDAIQLLACAHARDGNYNRAVSLIKDTLPISSGALLKEYESKFRAFRGKDPWTWRRDRMAKGFAVEARRCGDP